MTSRYLESVLLGENRGPVSWLIRCLLWPFAMIYLAVYYTLYRSGLRKRYRLSVPVVSVGNLTFGGTGKTPAVQAICRMLSDRGLKIAVLSRGHGGSARGALVASDGESILATSAEAGDEPILLAKSLRGIPVVVGKDRRQSGRLACERFSPDLIVLDDGLQYWQLHRDMDIVVLDAGKPFGSGFVVPMGDLREPITGLHRADVILLANARSLSDEERGHLVHRLSKLASHALIFPCAREPLSLRDAQTGEEHSPGWVSGRKVYAFCGIGRPVSFFDMLRGLGASIVETMAFPDHYRLSKADIAAIIDGARARGAEAIVTTEKDVARLDSLLCCGNADSGMTPSATQAKFPQLHALVIKLEIEDSSRFAEYITNRIDCKNTPAVN